MLSNKDNESSTLRETANNKRASQKTNTCLCNNKKPVLVTTVEESEIVCRKCGVVFGFDEDDNSNIIPYQHIIKSKINLYMKRQTGSRVHDYKKIIHCKNLRIEKNNNYDIISFGIICDKLKLSDFITEQCWKLYLKLRYSQTNFTRAKSTCFAIYLTCRQNRIPFSEGMVRGVVCQSLGVKKAPKLKSVIFKTDHADKTAEIDSKRQFYLNQHLSQAQKRHGLADITNLQHLAIQYYENFVSSRLNKNEKLTVMNNNSINTTINYNILAKRAVLLATQRCVV